MKNFLILSCSTGQGHNSCGEALCESFENAGIGAQLQDALDFISPKISRVISWGHSWIYCNIPGLFRWGYRYSENHPALFQEGTAVYRLLTAGSERLYEYIAEKGFDGVVCTHVFAALMLTHMQKTHPLDIETAFVSTDYTCSPITERCAVRRFFIPAVSLAEAYVQQGIPRERISATGIPVRTQFKKHTERADAKRLLGIKANSKHLLIMCGSMGCGPISKIVGRIKKDIPLDIEVSVICGKNQRLQKKLERQCGKSSGIHIVGYTKQMSLYMDSADLYLTKPGGITVTEAAVKNLPMAFINTVDGCETYNMRFFQNMGAAVTAASPTALVKECLRILNSAEVRRSMEGALREYDQPDGAEAIILQLCKGVLI